MILSLSSLDVQEMQQDLLNNIQTLKRLIMEELLKKRVQNHMEMLFI